MKHRGEYVQKNIIVFKFRHFYFCYPRLISLSLFIKKEKGEGREEEESSSSILLSLFDVHFVYSTHTSLLLFDIHFAYSTHTSLSLFDIHFIYSTHISLSLPNFDSRENRNPYFLKNIYYAFDDLIVIIQKLFHYRYLTLDLLLLFKIYFIIVIRF